MRSRSNPHHPAALLSATVMVVALSGCAAVTGPGGGTGAPQAITGSWRLADGTDGKGTIATGSAVVTLQIDGDKSGGHGPCNAFGATTKGSTVGAISIRVGIHTEMACADQQLNTNETRYFAALDAVTTAAISNGHLRLSGNGTALVFDKATR